MAFVVTVGKPQRFAKSRAVGACLGLTTRRFQSGEMDCSGRISKHGDGMLRSLLYEAVNNLINVVRKFAVILHEMLITGEPFRWTAIKGCVMA